MVRDLTGKHHLYYESTLQLRNISQEILDFAYQEIQRVGMRISKETFLDEGADLKLTDKNLTRALGKKLQSIYGGEFKETISIFGRKDGQEIYRTTVLFRGMGKNKKGDVVQYRGEDYKIILVGKDVLLQDINTGKKIHVKNEEMKNFKKVE